MHVRIVALVLLLSTAELQAGSPGIVLPPPVVPPPRVEPPERVGGPSRIAPPARITAPPRLQPPPRIEPAFVAPHRSINAEPAPSVLEAGMVRTAFGAARFDSTGSNSDTLETTPDPAARPTPLLPKAEPVGPTAPPAAPAPANPADLAPDFELESTIQKAAEGWPDLDAHVVVFDLAGLRRAEFTTGARIYPGSVVKLALVATVLEQFGNRELQPNRVVQLQAAPGQRRGDASVNVSELLRRTAREGDHMATNALLDLVGTDAVASTIETLELSSTAFERGFNRPARGAPPNRMAPADAARILYRMALDDLPGVGAASAMRALLARSLGDERLRIIPRYFPGTELMGWSADARMEDGLEVRNDVAYVSSGTARYVVAVYTQYEGDASPWITAFARSLHRALDASSAPR